MIPPCLTSFGESEPLPPLADAEFALGLNLNSKDPVVGAFADLMRRLTPLIVLRMEEEQGRREVA